MAFLTANNYDECSKYILFSLHITAYYLFFLTQNKLPIPKGVTSTDKSD